MLWLIGFFIVFIIILLIVIIVVSKRSKQKIRAIKSQAKEDDGSLESLIEILKTEKTEVAKINATLEKMLVEFPFPTNTSDAGEHCKYVYYYAKNPLTSAKMIVQMQKKLTQANPKYKKQIEDFQMRGVDARKNKK